MPLSFEEIDKELFKADSIDGASDFVATAVYVNAERGIYHSGLIIVYENTYYLFHYTGSDIEMSDFSKGNFYFKKLSFISPEEVLAFYAHCLNIQKYANPAYGFFFAGDYYDKEGKYYSESGVAEYMTCVGFCISVITGYIEGDQYYVYEDWNNEGVPEEFFERFIAEVKEQNPALTIDESLYKKHLRRITPTEYTSGAYLEIPVRKRNIDEILDIVRNVLLKRNTTT